MCVRVSFYRLVESLEYQRVVVSFTDDVGDNSPVIEIQNGAEVDLMHYNTLIPFELCDIGKPFFIGLVCMELTIQQIVGNILRILRLPCAAMIVVFDGGFNILCPTDTKDALIVDVDIVVMLQIIIDAAVSLIWTVHVYLLYFFGKRFVFSSLGT